MATITITVSDEMLARLTHRAADRNTTVDALITPALNAMSTELTPRAERDRAFSEWMAFAAERDDRYPAGFIADGSRESIYEGCGE